MFYTAMSVCACREAAATFKSGPGSSFSGEAKPRTIFIIISRQTDGRTDRHTPHTPLPLLPHSYCVVHM